MHDLPVSSVVRESVAIIGHQTQIQIQPSSPSHRCANGYTPSHRCANGYTGGTPKTPRVIHGPPMSRYDFGGLFGTISREGPKTKGGYL